MPVRLGLRVVRGPDWEGGNVDGGEGYLGTVVAGPRGADDSRHDVATVQWDVGGERRVYRCGAQGKCDLRVIDSAPAGQPSGNSELSCGSVVLCVLCVQVWFTGICCAVGVGVTG